MSTPTLVPVPTLSNFQRSQLWNAWIGAATRTLYYSNLAGRFTAWQNWISGTSLFFSLSTVGALMASPVVAAVPSLNTLLPWAKVLLPVATGALNVVALFKQYTKRSYECSELYTEWGKLELECKTLWGDMYEVNAPVRLAAIEEKALRISAPSTRSMPNKERLMEKYQDQATAQIKASLGV